MNKRLQDPIREFHLHKEKPAAIQFQICDLKKYLLKNQGKTDRAHFHSYYQIIWFTKGKGKHFVDFESFDFEDNSLFFIAKNQIHYFDDNLNVDGYILQFNESFFIDSQMDMFLKFNLFNSSQSPVLKVDPSSTNAIKSLINIIQDQTLNEHPFGQEPLLRYLLKSLLIIFKRFENKDHSTDIHLQSHYEVLYLKFRNLMEENIQQNLLVQDFASALSISSKTLTSLCKDQSSKTPSQLIQERKLLEAERYLRFSSLKVNEIAFKLGFEDDSYFAKFYKKHRGISPGDWRKSIQVD